MTGPRFATYRLRFYALPRGELNMYRGLRQLGFDRYAANLVMFGRWTARMNEAAAAAEVTLRLDR